MKDATRIKVAALLTALFVGLLTAGGLALRTSHIPHATAAGPTRPSQPSLAGHADDDRAAAPDATDFAEPEDE